MKVAQVINGEFHRGAEAINLNLENSGLVQFGYENRGSREVYKGMLECVNNSFTELFQKEKGIVSIIAKSSELVKDMKCHRKPEPGTLENEDLSFIYGDENNTDRCPRAFANRFTVMRTTRIDVQWHLPIDLYTIGTPQCTLSINEF
ncbi:hypothetical protein RHGRI_023178 [Rhododendron griersonianum]|uniref:Uncharacterized protein n=1 Tax=Rhododendron griersonianum TaxID=479676 RepID=A0AAV6J5X4_9ERIC|nr:hypothetical protein RHGRI_023178 [Rhododendron griersonianum]